LSIKIKKKKLKKLKWHFDRAWGWFSKFVRVRDRGVCFTCGKVDDWKNMHAGHFKHNRLDFDERNVNCQCVGCNTYRNGRLDVYAERLEQIYGSGIVQELSTLSKIDRKYTREDYDYIAERYEKIFNELVKYI
jgi:hypothetical protein